MLLYFSFVLHKLLRCSVIPASKPSCHLLFSGLLPALERFVRLYRKDFLLIMFRQNLSASVCFLSQIPASVAGSKRKSQQSLVPGRHCRMTHNKETCL